MKSFVYNNFSDLYINNRIDLSSYIDGECFYLCLLRSRYTPNANHRTYFDIKSSEYVGTGYNKGGQNISVTLDEDTSSDTYGSLFGSDVSWTEGIDGVRYAVLYLKTSDENNGMLLSCYDFDSERSYTGTFTLSWNGVELISISKKSIDVDRYVIDLDTKTVYTPSLDEEGNEIVDEYKGITEKKLYIEYSDETKSQLTLISLAGKVDEDPDDDNSIDNDEKDLIPDFVSYKVFEKYAKTVEKLDDNFGASSLNFIGVLVAYDDNEVNFQTWLKEHNHQDYKIGDTVIVSVRPLDETSEDDNIEIWVETADVNDSTNHRTRATSNDIFICTSDSTYTVGSDDTVTYTYQRNDWKFVNSNTVDILSNEEATSGDIPLFDSTGKLLTTSGIHVSEDGDYYSISVTEPYIITSSNIATRDSSGDIVEYLLKSQEEIRPLDPEEALIALNVTHSDLFDRLSDEEIEDIKNRLDIAYEALGESGMMLSTDNINDILSGSGS